MTTQQDCSLGFLKESVYGTPVTVSRWLEYATDPEFNYLPNRVQGDGMRAGQRVDRTNRRVTTTSEAGGSVELEMLSKGLGTFLELCLGAGASTLVSGTTYQQVFTLSDTPPSATFQVGIVRDATTVAADTYLGCAVDSFEFTGDNGGILKLKATLDARAVDTTIAYAAPSYPTASATNLFHFANAAIYSGALTAPTATALAAGATELANVRSWSVAVARNLGKSTVFGDQGKKRKVYPGKPAITGKLEVEYVDATFRDAYLADTPMSLVVTYEAGALSSGKETIQIVIPEIKFDGEMPKPNGADLVVSTMAFTGLDNAAAAQPIWVVMRTSDAAL